MKIPGILKPEGHYDRGSYILADISTQMIMAVLIVLASLHVAWIPVAAIGVPLLFYINIISTIKRLRDLGRPESDFILLFIPVVSMFLDFSLRWNPGDREVNEMGYRDYKIRQYRKKHRLKPRTPGSERNTPERYTDFWH